MLLNFETVGRTSITLNRTTDGGFMVLALTGDRFGASYFGADEEKVARSCYANTVSSAREEQKRA